MENTLTGTVVDKDSLSERETDHLYRLFERYYRKVDRAVFDRDLEEKDNVLLLRDSGGGIRGFTTLKLYDLVVAGRPLRAVFNGNTIIEQEFWGNQELVRTWCRFMSDLKAEAPHRPLYWFLISSGYRTYLYLPFFFREFYPRHDRVSPSFEAALIDILGLMKFPDEYRDGVVRVREARECLDAALAVPPPHKLRNPHVAFFLEKNPEYLRGDELVCITEYSLENTCRYAHEALKQAVVSP